MSSHLRRTVLLSLLALAILAAAPAFAGPAVAPAIQAPAIQAPAGCPPAADLFTATGAAQVCKLSPAVATPEPPSFMATTTPFTGYCHCGCRRVKDCNTDADCGGGRCLGGVSCC